MSRPSVRSGDANASGKRRLRILVVEDDADINEVVAASLERAGHDCTRAFSGTEGRLVLDGGGAPFDAVVCDLMLPGMTGEELIAHIRARRPAPPVLVISARGSVHDRVDVLRAGADDYLVKPFDLEELVARMEALLRRAGSAAQAAGAGGGADGPDLPDASATREPDERRTVGKWTLDTGARELTVDGSTIPLTKTEFGIVEALSGHRGRVFTKQELFETVWGEPYAVEDNTVNAHISNLRAKLRPSGTDGYIKTVWGIGFKLDPREE